MRNLFPSRPFITSALAIASFLGVAVSASTASTLVVPLGLDAHEGSGSSGILNQAGREQTVYRATIFPGGPINITELHFRPNVTDYMPGSAFSATNLGLRIVLSTTSMRPGALSPHFNENTGSNADVVVNGGVALFSAFTGPDAGPKDFDIVIPLDHAFTYDPAQGNLLVDIQNFSGDPTSPVDAEFSRHGAASRVVSGSPTSSSGVLDDAADVLRIVYSQHGTNPPPAGPVILSQPANATVPAGQTAVFSVLARGAAPLNYQWIFNRDIILPGATNSALTLTNTQPDQAGLYSVRVSNSVGSTNSAAATLTVTPVVAPGYICAVLRGECVDAPPPPRQAGEIVTGSNYVIMTVAYGDPGDLPAAQRIVTDAVFQSLMPRYCGLPKTGCVTDSVQWNIMTYDVNGSWKTSGCAASGCQKHLCADAGDRAPFIVRQTTNLTVSVGQSATFVVVAHGATPLNYQWFFDETNALAEATNSVLVLPHVQTNQAGTYLVRVSNFLGAVDSLPAKLIVNPGPGVTNGYITAVLRSECTSAPTPPPPLGATRVGPDYVIMTVADANPTDLPDARRIVTDAIFESLMPLYCGLSGSSGIGCVTNRVQWNILTYDTNGNEKISAGPTSGAQFHSCADVVPGYICAVLRSDCTSAPPPPPHVGGIVTGPDYVIMTVAYGDPRDWTAAKQIATDAAFQSIMPLYCSLPKLGCLTPSVQWNIITYNGNGSPNTSGCAASGCEKHSCGDPGFGPPVIVDQPTNQTVTAGQSAIFSVTATSEGPLGYQWIFGRTNILAGATNSSLLLTNVQPRDAGIYQVRVANAAGGTNSATATLTVTTNGIHGYICAVLRSECTSDPTPPPRVGATNIGPDYVILTVANGNPADIQGARQIVTDAVFESLMPLYCGLPGNSGVGCVTNRVQWSIVTYDTNGNSVLSTSPTSGARFHSCSEVNHGPGVTNGYITAVLRSDCTSAPIPPPVGATNIGPDYVIMTVADANPTNFTNAQQIVTDAVFESLMPLYCGLPGNSGAGCVTNRVKWNIITYNTDGGSIISGSPTSGARYHSCEGGGDGGNSSPGLSIAPSTNGIGLSWPNQSTNLILEASSNLVNWTAIEGATVTNGGRLSIQMPAPGGGLFYRLRPK